MDDAVFPITLARGAIRLAPPPLLEHGAQLLLRRMRRAHPALFGNLARLDHATISFEPSDLPHRFRLALGGGPPSLRLSRASDPPATTVVKGELAALLALLEGRIDSDALFFTRALTITGDTSAVVALRNTLDRETIVLLDEVTALLGPLRRLGRAGALRWERRIGRLRDRLAARRAPLAPPPSADRSADSRALHQEIDAIKARLARLEARQRRTTDAAA